MKFYEVNGLATTLRDRVLGGQWTDEVSRRSLEEALSCLVGFTKEMGKLGEAGGCILAMPHCEYNGPLGTILEPLRAALTSLGDRDLVEFQKHMPEAYSRLLTLSFNYEDLLPCETWDPDKYEPSVTPEQQMEASNRWIEENCAPQDFVRDES